MTSNGGRSAVGISSEQVRFYQTFGYLVLKSFFSPEELKVICSEVDCAFEEQHDEPFDGNTRRDVYLVDELTPFCAGLLENPRCLTAAKQLEGEDILGHVCHAAEYVGDSDWHRDTKTSFQSGMGFRCYLDPVDADSGALQVMPTSHRIPRYYDDDDPLWAGVVPLPVKDVPATCLATKPGDVVAIDFRIWHGSYGGRPGRRMVSVDYFDNPRNVRSEQFLCEQAVLAGKAQLKAKSGRDYIFARNWLFGTAVSEQRQQWISRLGDMGYFDPPGVVQKD